MKKTLLMLALGMASSTVFAAPETGQINFYGTVYAGGTCPIELVHPGGSVIPGVSLKNFTTGYFHTRGTVTPDYAFALRVNPISGCTIAPNSKATVTFTPLHGVVGTNLYGIRGGGAAGLGVLIKDQTRTKLAPDTASVEYDLYTSRPTDMIFYAAYESYEDTVGEGLAEAEVSFLVSLP